MRLLRILLLRPVGLGLAMVLLLSPRHGITTAETQIKWTAATTSKEDPAHTAPKSQRYWDQHQIERPDYAKTDAEVAAERLDRMVGGRGTTMFLQNYVLLWLGGAVLILVMIGGRWSAHMKISDGTGHRLGGGSGVRFFHRTTTTATSSSQNGVTTNEEQTRRARLARFAATGDDDNKSKQE